MCSFRVFHRFVLVLRVLFSNSVVEIWLFSVGLIVVLSSLVIGMSGAFYMLLRGLQKVGRGSSKAVERPMKRQFKGS